MGKAKQRQTRKVSVAKTIKKTDQRLELHASTRAQEKMKADLGKKAREYEAKTGKKYKPEEKDSKGTFEGAKITYAEQASTSLFFTYNKSLGPPYRILIDTNFINFSIQNKLDLFTSLMDCLLAKCIPIITDCVMAELEKLGIQYRVALRIAKDPRIERYKCTHKGVYADDCIINRISQSRTFIVATCDRDLKQRIRKIPGVPIMYITQRRYSIERFPDTNAAPFK